jgi:hypothetical protein
MNWALLDGHSVFVLQSNQANQSKNLKDLKRICQDWPNGSLIEKIEPLFKGLALRSWPYAKKISNLSSCQDKMAANLTGSN